MNIFLLADFSVVLFLSLFPFFFVFFGCASGKKNLKKEKLKQATFPFGTNEKESSSVSFSWALFFPLPSQASC